MPQNTKGHVASRFRTQTAGEPRIDLRVGTIELEFLQERILQNLLRLMGIIRKQGIATSDGMWRSPIQIVASEFDTSFFGGVLHIKAGTGFYLDSNGVQQIVSSDSGIEIASDDLVNDGVWRYLSLTVSETENEPGTITLTNGDPNVTGSGTFFARLYQKDDGNRGTRIVSAGGNIYEIQTISSDTAIVLTGNALADETDVAFKIHGTFRGSDPATGETYSSNPDVVVTISDTFPTQGLLLAFVQKSGGAVTVLDLRNYNLFEIKSSYPARNYGVDLIDKPFTNPALTGTSLAIGTSNDSSHCDYGESGFARVIAFVEISSGDLKSRFSQDNGSSFLIADERTILASGNNQNPCLFTIPGVNNDLYVAFETENLGYATLGNNAIVVGKSTDGGLTWGSFSVVVEDITTDSKYPWLDFLFINGDSEPQLLCFYKFGNDIRYKKSNDFGASWSSHVVCKSVGGVGLADTQFAVGHSTNNTKWIIAYSENNAVFNGKYIKATASTGGDLSFGSALDLPIPATGSEFGMRNPCFVEAHSDNIILVFTNHFRDTTYYISSIYRSSEAGVFFGGTWTNMRTYRSLNGENITSMKVRKSWDGSIAMAHAESISAVQNARLRTSIPVLTN